MKNNLAPAVDNDICVGVITSVNGVKGYVKIRSFTDQPSDIAKFDFIFDPESKQNFQISVVSSKKDYFIGKIVGINNRTEAEKLRNTKLYIKRSALPNVSEEEYYHADLIGTEARSEEGVIVGTIKNIVNFGAGDILEVYDKTSENTVYYPFTKQFVPEINITQKFIVLKPLEEVVAAVE